MRITYFSHYPERVNSILTYKKDILNGPGQFFYTNGVLEQSVNYNDGKLDGPAYYFHSSGNLKAIRRWYNGKRVGFQEEFFDTSALLYQTILLYDSSGKLRGEKEYTLDGNLIWEKDF